MDHSVARVWFDVLSKRATDDIYMGRQAFEAIL